MKLVVNSAYGYLGAVGLTRFADVHAANEVTRRGREVLGAALPRARARAASRCSRRTPTACTSRCPTAGREADERRVVAEVAALLPAARAARVRRALRRDALARAEELRAPALRRAAGPARRRVSLEPRRALRRGRSCAARCAACSRATSPGVREAYVATVHGAAPRARCPRCEVAARGAADQDAGRSTSPARARGASSPTRPARERARRSWARRRARPRLPRGGRPRGPAARRPTARSRRRRRGRPARRAEATRATTTSSTTCGCCARRSPRGWRARSRPRTSRRCSPTRSSRRSSPRHSRRCGRS